MTASHTRYRPDPTVATQDLGDRILLTPLGGDHLVLEGTAATLWRLLDQPRSVSALADECARRYDGAPDQILADIEDTVNDWIARGLLRTADPSSETTAGSK
ncbi:PqqD family protein [Nocardia terpenica]|uniref:PqqD family protein n=1 Tax=Nocardia terpenica TaxID=455432 RepID=UPI0018943FF2|nr:PqqD family protein [Nocardia terpenica]MBF6066075.1 PqqD family protein [Nocardia terpenica]MBF6109234.1 PqqD family protein [Nocardia terpenica]MBF6116319.1 PqqD family protein [Nocardia terpenica]MBF6123476.1 PqqD family protein [Nocardia terpenica]MBF6156753.1 PqqD family protein [Nocardia terpenica]